MHKGHLHGQKTDKEETGVVSLHAMILPHNLLTIGDNLTSPTYFLPVILRAATPHALPAVICASRLRDGK